MMTTTTTMTPPPTTMMMTTTTTTTTTTTMMMMMMMMKLQKPLHRYKNSFLYINLKLMLQNSYSYLSLCNLASKLLRIVSCYRGTAGIVNCYRGTS